MEKFIKTSSAKLSGLEKAAVLLAELGPAFNNNYAALEQALNLSEKEKIKLANAMKNLGSYNPAVHGIGEILREESVLNEVIDELSSLTGKNIDDSKRDKIIKAIKNDKVPNDIENKW